MSIETSHAIAALAGSVQQQSSPPAHNRQVSDVSPGAKTKRPIQTPAGLQMEENNGSDSTSISRPGIVALESTQNTGSDNVIRDKDSAGEALAYSESQITDYPDRATLAQANQTPQQVLALEG